MKITFDSQTIDLTPTGSGKSFRATLGDKMVDVEVLRSDEGKLDMLIDGEHVSAYVSSDGAKRWVTVNGQTLVLTKSTAGARKSSGHEHASDLMAPMPGVVRSVNVSEGQSVSKGQTLMVLEAMKMEIRIQAKSDGVVKKLFVQQGQTVEREQLLVEVE
jgi:acetyl/propionyl-CoA carboxylase alpha subunit